MAITLPQILELINDAERLTIYSRTEQQTVFTGTKDADGGYKALRNYDSRPVEDIQACEGEVLCITVE